MIKELLLEKYIKKAVRKSLREAEEQAKQAEKAMYLVYRFPGLKKLMEDLMSPAYGRFINNIDLTTTNNDSTISTENKAVTEISDISDDVSVMSEFIIDEPDNKPTFTEPQSKPKATRGRKKKN
jgi:hypothetical protein